MNLVQSFLTKNPCYTKGEKIVVKGLMLHSVGCSQPNANVFIRLWNSPNYTSACVHGFIDANDGIAYQTLPWDHRGWHCAKSGNNTHIGIEMCEPASITYIPGTTSFTCSDKVSALAAVKRTYDTAVQLFVMLCLQFKLDPLADGVILSHKEGAYRGIASNHGDPEHLWTGLSAGYTMDGFRKDVNALVKAALPSVSIPADMEYKVQVGAGGLTIYSEANINSAVKGYANPGVYTIVAESTGTGADKWGKLKSGAGWIILDCCIKFGSDATQAVSEAEQAIDKLSKIGAIEDPGYWKKKVDTIRHLDKLFIKAASKITGGPIFTPEEGIDRLVKDGIIETSEYWMSHFNDDPNLGKLLIDLGRAKKD